MVVCLHVLTYDRLAAFAGGTLSPTGIGSSPPITMVG